MPPLAYNASFTVNTIVFGFDVMPSSYGEQTEANLTIRAIPWAPTYTVIVQGAASTQGATLGSKAVTRTYKAIVYTETDYLLLRGQRGQIGALLTARQTVLQAVMTDCKRDSFQDNTDPAGPQIITVGFTMVQ